MTAWEPTNNRGKALLREIMDLIDKQVANAGVDSGENKANAWDQDTWGGIAIETFEDNAQYGGVRSLGGDRQRKTLKIDPELVQNAYANLSCGTAMCFAGHVTLLVGDTPIIDAVEAAGVLESRDTPSIHWGHVVPKGGTRTMSVHDRAAQLLEISDREAHVLFSPFNSHREIQTMVDNLVNDRHIDEGF